MEEFKIINLKTNKETEEKIDEKPIKQEIEGYKPPKKRYLIAFLLILVVIVALVISNIIGTYNDYNVENSWDRDDTSESKYAEFQEGLLKYSADGVFYTEFNGELNWNFTYNITNPVLDFQDNYVVIYDKNGNDAYLFSTKGYINTVTTTSPIIKCEVSSKGTIALMLQENEITYLQIYDSKGKELVSGEIHQDNGVYPVSMSFSSSGSKIAISSINLESGSVGTQITFYDFSSDGKKKEDNIVAQYNYEDIIYPEIKFFKGDEAVVFGENEIIIFNNNFDCTISKEIYISDQIKNIFYNEEYFGYVTEVADENGELTNKFTVYNLLGLLCVEKNFEETYSNIELLDNDEVLIQDTGNITLYSMQGIKKFSYEFGENIYRIFAGSKNRRYYLIKENVTEEIQIK